MDISKGQNTENAISRESVDVVTANDTKLVEDNEDSDTDNAKSLGFESMGYSWPPTVVYYSQHITKYTSVGETD